MKDSYQKVVAASAILLVIAVVTIGNMILQKLDRIARLTEQKKSASAQAKVPADMPPREAGPEQRVMRPRRVASAAVPAAPPAALAESRASEAASPAVQTMPAPQPGNKIRLSPSVPKPLFMGIPRSFESLLLQDSWKGAERGVQVPKGTRLLSAKKTVTASDPAPIIGDLPMVTDGDKEGSDGSYVELGPGPQWVQIDLEAEYPVYAIALWHYHAQARVYHDVALLLSRTADFAEPTIVFNNDADNSLGLGEGQNREYVDSSRGLLQGVDGTRARYVRLYSNGNTANDLNHYIEVEVYGLPEE